MSTTKVTISLPQDLLTAVDNIAKERGAPRSSVITEILEDEVEKIEEKSMIEGYIALAGENKAFADDSLPLAREVLAEWK